MQNLRGLAHTWLRKSERIFKTDMVYLAKGGFWLTLLQTINSFSSFFLAVGFAHLLPKETYGTYKYIFSLSGIISAFSLSGLGAATVTAVAQGKDATLRFAANKNLRWSIPMFLVFLGVALYYFLQGHTNIGASLILIGIATPIISSTAIADSFLLGKKDFRASVATSSLSTVFIYSTTLIVAALTKNVVGVVGAFIGSSFLAGVTIYIYVSRTKVKNNQVSHQTLNYGSHLSLINIINTLTDRLDSMLIFHFLGAAELATYTFAVAIPEQIKGFIKSASTLALPKFSATHNTTTYANIWRKMLIMTILVIPIIGLYIFTAPYIFDLFFPQYQGETVFYSQIFVLSLITAGGALPPTYLQGVAAKRELYFYNMISGALQITLMAFGVIYFGIMGLVLSISISRIFRFIYSSILMKKVNRRILEN